MSDSKSNAIPPWLEFLLKYLLAPALLLLIGAYISKANFFPQKLQVTVKNKLALPIAVEVNNKKEYTTLAPAGGSVTITLYSDSEFPVHIYWSVRRNKNNKGEYIGEELRNFGADGDESISLDKGGTYTVDNSIGLSTYFYPMIENNTDNYCTIFINDGLTTQYYIGQSSPHTTANQTGYYKLASNSNVTLKCPTVYFRGKRNGKTGPALQVDYGSGVARIPIP